MAGNRWEWRAFAESFGGVDRILRENVVPRESRETYVLHDHSLENVKVRGGILDVKTLLDVNGDGLQLWCPALKSPFPLPAAIVRKVFARWGSRAPLLRRAAYTEEQWFDEVVGAVAELQATLVEKRRFGSLANDCLIESADLLVDGMFLRTVGVESANPAAVARTISALGLVHMRNEDYQAALKRVAGSRMVRSTAPWRAHV